MSDVCGLLSRPGAIVLAFLCLIAATVPDMLTSPLAAADSPSTRRTNVVLIIADDLGWGDLGCYGHPRFKTPHIDQLARDGTRFTQCSAPYPYCAPTRAALLTGRHPFRSGMTGNPTPDAGINDLGLPGSEVSLGEAFQAAGYRTQAIGKWHLGHKPEFYPTKHGFHNYLGILYSNDMRPVRLLDNERVVEYPLVQATLTQRYTERALQFLEAHREQPFFLYFAHTMPHKPLAASEKFYKSTSAGLYADVLAELDASVGQVLAKLKELKLDEQTLVLFTSDNGPWYGGSTGGLRGMKGQSTEGGTRVPLIARWPGKISAGTVSEAVVTLTDLYPTVLAAAGVALPKVDVIDGKNLLPVLLEKAKSPHDHLVTFSGPRVATVRQGPWKLFVNGVKRERNWSPEEIWNDPRGPDGVTILAPAEQYPPRQHPGLKTGDVSDKPALFHLGEDPGEQHNVAGQQAEIVARLLKYAQSLQQEMDAARDARQKNAPAKPAATAIVRPANKPEFLAEIPRGELRRQLEASIRELTAEIEKQPKSVDLHSRRGDLRLFNSEFAAAVADYETMVELDRSLDNSHWRRGIAYFYAGRYKDAAHQFEIYHSFDDVDRENGIWRYLSQAKAHGKKTAREGLLKYKKDDREPFPQVYKLFAGETTPEAILSAIEQAKISDLERENRLFYAHLYIGLNEFIEDRFDTAERHLRQAVHNNWAPRAGFGPHYMWQVARVHYLTLTSRFATPD